jgi:hypothetical protein
MNLRQISHAALLRTSVRFFLKRLAPFFEAGALFNLRLQSIRRERFLRSCGGLSQPLCMAIDDNEVLRN